VVPDDPNDNDKDKTPVQPFMSRRRTSQTALTAIGWRTCPSCKGDDRAECELCWDPGQQRYDRKVPPDVYIEYLQKHPEAT
jgi:hypothetical protein